MSERRRICVVTGTRADYGLLRWLMREIHQDGLFELQIIATGMHLSPEFGCTYQEIEHDGFHIDEKIEVLLSSDTGVGYAKSLGLAVIGFAETLSRLSPDFVVVLGDRFEVLAASQAALVQRIPVAHIHGGELSAGAIDDSFRHAVTKLSHLHFVAAEEYRRRVIQLGESPERVFYVGAPGLDQLRHMEWMDRAELEDELEISLTDTFFVITYHPVTLYKEDPIRAMQSLFSALDLFPEAKGIFTKPNADAGGREIIRMLDDYAKLHPDRVRVVTSLGHRRYLSLVKYSRAVVGNSSSGIIEVPVLGVPTVNIGHRQDGRLRASSVIDVEPEAESIGKGIRMALSQEFRDKMHDLYHPYGQGDASVRIKETLKSFDPESLLVKRFYDISH